MSWLKEMATGDPLPAYKDKSEEKVKDPYIPGRMVSNKPANRPFLGHKEYRDRQEALHQAWLQKKKERDEKIARGEKVGPLEPDPTEVTEVGLVGLLKFFFIVFVCIALAGKFFTGSYTWDYRSKWLLLKTYMPQNSLLFSEGHLANFNGEDGRPAYLAIDGEVYDVSKGKAYQIGGSYHHFVGIDAARAFGTGCFQTHRTHDLRGLTKEELAGVEHWKKFYAEHQDYHRVGRVNHPPIDPASPLPEHCDPKKAKAEKERQEAEQKLKDRHKAKHDEL